MKRDEWLLFGGRLLWFAFCLSGALIVAGSGCSLWNPGGQVRRSLTQSDWTVVGGESGLDTQFDGTHAKAVLYMEGPKVKATTTEGGDVVPNLAGSVLTRLYWSKPDTAAAQGAWAQAAQVSMAQSQHLTEAFTSMLETFAPLIAARAQPPAVPAVIPPAPEP